MFSIRKIHSSEGAIPVEWLHRQSIPIDNVSFADLNHDSTVRSKPPRLVEQLPNLFISLLELLLFSFTWHHGSII